MRMCVTLVLIAPQPLLGLRFAHTGLFRKDGIQTRDELPHHGPAYDQSGRPIWGPVAYFDKYSKAKIPPIKLYHYTPSKKAFAILKSGVLKASTKRQNPMDSRHGDGQYFTSMPPWADDDDLVYNNYDGAARGMSSGDKVGGYVEIDARRFVQIYGYDSLDQVPPDEVDGRDIFVMGGSYNLPIKAVPHKVCIDWSNRRDEHTWDAKEKEYVTESFRRKLDY